MGVMEDYVRCEGSLDNNGFIVLYIDGLMKIRLSIYFWRQCKDISDRGNGLASICTALRSSFFFLKL